jgi:hypothetical protein
VFSRVDSRKRNVETDWMTLLTLLLSLLLGSKSAPVQNRRLPYTGAYAFKHWETKKFRPDLRLLEIYQLNDTTIKYRLALSSGSPYYHSGRAENILPVRHGIAVDSLKDYFDTVSECFMTLHLYHDSVVIECTNNGAACGWGARISADGKYYRYKRVPDLKENEHGLYAVIGSHQAMVFEDSVLTRPKGSYIKSGKVFEYFNESSKSIYTEIYDKKKQTFIFGWVSYDDLKND